MRNFIYYTVLAAFFGLIAYTFHVERKVIAATDRINATTAELRLKAGLDE